MIISSQYNYTIILAFECLLKFEGKRSLNITTIQKYRQILLGEIRKNNDDILFEKINEEEALKNFLDDYDDYFYCDNETVYLKDNITYKDISDLEIDCRKNDEVPDWFYIINDDNDLMDILGITSIEAIIKDYLKVEEKIENMYNKLYTAEDNDKLRKSIKQLLFVRFSFLGRIYQMPGYRVDAFRTAIMRYNWKYEKMDFDVYPFDKELYLSDFDDDEDEFNYDIDAPLTEITEYAIFGKESNYLCNSKLEEDLDAFYMSNKLSGNYDKIDYNEDYSEFLDRIVELKEEFENGNKKVVKLKDPTEEFQVLFLNYINNLNKFMSVYGENDELMRAKKRLIYAIDNPDTLIFEDDNFIKEYNKTKNFIVQENSFSFFYNQIVFIVEEIFKRPSNEYTIRKLLLAGAYYYLTKDEVIKGIMKEYKEDSRYNFFYEVIINNCNSKMVNDMPNEIKKLVLKK